MTRIVKRIAVLLITVCALQVAVSSAQPNPRKPPDDVDIRSVDIYSEGTRMTGTVYTPKAAGAQKLPTIVMAHGWGGTQRSLRRDAVGFARAGYLVVSFDYRGWGTSDSRMILKQPAPDHTVVSFKAEVQAIREVVDPLDMGTDWLNTLHWIQGEDNCDTARIGIWGSSMAGGYVVYAAAHDPRVKAVHSQVTGTLNGRDWGRSPGSRLQATQRARGEVGYPEPREKFNGLTGAPITPRFADYTPSLDIQSNDSVALQFVLAEEEEYGGNPIAIQTHDAHDGPKNLVIIEGINHYDIYRKAWQQSFDHAVAWFDQHLKED